MFKVKTIVLSVCSTFAIVGCASLEQFSDQAAQALTRGGRRHTELTADELYRVGRQYQGEVRYDHAIAAYLKALEQDHTRADAHNGLGVIYAEQGRYDDAISEFKAAIELKPGEAYLHNNLGYVLLLRGLTREALSPLEIAVQLEPANTKALFNLRFAHERLGDVPRDATIPSAASADTPKPLTGIKAPTADPPAPSDPRLVAVAPNIYELKLPAPVQPQATAASQATTDESPLLPPSSQQARTARSFRLEVSNGNGTEGMARRVAHILDQNGIHTNRITNHATFRQRSTEIQYRAGYLAEASGLREILPAELKAVSSSSLRSDIHVRVLLGRDSRSAAALRPHAKLSMTSDK